VRSRKACLEGLAEFIKTGKLKPEEVMLIADVQQLLYQDEKQAQTAKMSIVNRGTGNAIGVLNGSLTINVD
jgi:hypothetical protein